jgi:pimeloyl-ACP methyl ester carboxylesterase
MRSLSTSAGRLAVRDQGSGPPVVLLHATLHDHRDFDPIVPALADSHRVIAIDWPGHGASEPPRPGTVADGPLFARVLEDVVGALDLGPAVLIGNSVGGFAAGRLAIERPELVAGLVLVNAGGFSTQNAITRTFCRVMGMPRVTRRVLPRMVRSYMKPRTDHDRALTERVQTRAKSEAGARTAAGLWRSFASPEYDLRARASEITAPTLLVWGSRDTVLPMRAGRQTQKAIPGSRLESLPTGHVVFSSDPEGFLALVLPFIDRAFAGARPPAPARRS